MGPGIKPLGDVDGGEREPSPEAESGVGLPVHPLLGSEAAEHVRADDGIEDPRSPGSALAGDRGANPDGLVIGSVVRAPEGDRSRAAPPQSHRRHPSSRRGRPSAELLTRTCGKFHIAPDGRRTGDSYVLPRAGAAR